MTLVKVFPWENSGTFLPRGFQKNFQFGNFKIEISSLHAPLRIFLGNFSVVIE